LHRAPDTKVQQKPDSCRPAQQHQKPLHLHELQLCAGAADESELIEEYDATTNELLLRKKRKPKPLGGPGEWEYYQGEEAPGYKRPQAPLAENSKNVRFWCNDRLFILVPHQTAPSASALSYSRR
jgi:DPCD protein family